MTAAVRAGQVYQGTYFGIQYHVLAVWGDYAWVLMITRTERELHVPRTETLEFLRQFPIKYDLEAHNAV